MLAPLEGDAAADLLGVVLVDGAEIVELGKVVAAGVPVAGSAAGGVDRFRLSRILIRREDPWTARKVRQQGCGQMVDDEMQTVGGIR